MALSGQIGRFIRMGLTEEYTVSVDGVRQDFVIEQRLEGTRPGRMETEVEGAKAEAMGDGARLVLADGGRKLVYNRLKAEDARGQAVKAKLEVLSDSRLAVVCEDADALYPLRIDPTFSDANWTIMNPGVPGVDGAVSAAAVDSAGNLYIGGLFTIVGDTVATNIVKWDGTRWSALGSGTDQAVYALAVSGSTLYAGGYFKTAGGSPATNIAKWDGTSWSALGSGLSGVDVYSLAVSGSDAYAGGAFLLAGGVHANHIAKWDGSSWSALSSASGMNGQVLALATSGTTLYAGGAFTTAGGGVTNYIAKWDGSSWSALGSWTENQVHALAASGANVYAGGGAFKAAGGSPAKCVAQWDGSSWSALGSGANSLVYALAVSGSNV
jgi:hypothetical protein